MKRAVLLLCAALIACAGVVFAPPGAACACSCAAPAPQSIVDRAPAVVQGTPVAVRQDGFESLYTVNVSRSYKQVLPNQITVRTASSSAACGLELELNRGRVLVLGGPAEGPVGADWTASLCSNLAGPAQILQYAGEPSAPLGAPALDSEPSGGENTVVWVVVAVTIFLVVDTAAVLSWLAIRRRRRS